MTRKSLAAGLVLSALAAYLAVRQARPAAMAAALSGAQPGLLVLGTTLLLVTVAVRSRRWQLLFGPAVRVTFGGALSATFIGYLLNSVLPGRLGEFGRAYLIGESDGVSKGRALGTIFVEKLLDVFVLMLFLGIVALGMPLPLPRWATQGAATAAAIAAGATLTYCALARVRASIAGWIRARIERLPGLRRRRLSRFVEFVETALGAADNLARPLPLLGQVALSAAVWALSAGVVYTVMRSFHLPVPPAAAVLVLAVTNLGMTIPSAPAYVGVYHLLATETLKLFGVDQNAALSYAITMHAITFGTFILGGLVCMWRRHYVFDLRRCTQDFVGRRT